MPRRVSLSITISAIGHLYGGDLAALTDLARIADATGIDQLVIPDHVVMGPHLENYPYGRFPLPLEEPWPEPLTDVGRDGRRHHARALRAPAC